MRSLRGLPRRDVLLILLPVLAACLVASSPLAFVPPPWPDDSAFYFVAKALFHWPPRWVMLPQAPFEPTYRVWNFNTMPLFPLLIGLGRFLGIDGSLGLKLWSIGPWALTGGFMAWALRREKLAYPIAAALVALVAFDPILRWGAVVVRPESMIGLAGVVLVYGLSLGWFDEDPKGMWDPVAALLAVAAYSHFNAIHLLFAVAPVFHLSPRRFLNAGWKTALYLSPWLLTIALHPALFSRQMSLQWGRLAVPNSWLHSPAAALGSFFPHLGSPEVWPPVVLWTALVMWAIVVAAVAGLIVGSAARKTHPRLASLAPAAGWVIGALWLWNGKPEVWFVYYIHLALWAFLSLAALQAWRAGAVLAQTSVAAAAAVMAVLFLAVDVSQWRRMSGDDTWTWGAYRDLVSCVDRTLTDLDARKGRSEPLRVWNATYPDVIVELSRRHPDWDLSRHNDFVAREDLALQHGRDVDAVIVTETFGWSYLGMTSFGWSKRDLDSDWKEHPEVRSYWLTLPGNTLNRLDSDPAWKPRRHLCQRGRWQAFILMDR